MHLQEVRHITGQLPHQQRGNGYGLSTGSTLGTDTAANRGAVRRSWHQRTEHRACGNRTGSLEILGVKQIVIESILEIGDNSPYLFAGIQR